MMARPVDMDGDGQISEGEHMDSAPTALPMGRRNAEQLYVNRAARIKAMDADGDGNLTLAEVMAKAQASHKASHADKDGKVSVWEFRVQQNPCLSSHPALNSFARKRCDPVIVLRCGLWAQSLNRAERR